jgi:tRNA(fMet)-specific endonuclease VapC
MEHLLDSDIVIYHLNDIPAATNLVDRLFDSGIALSSITLMEVIEGLDRASDPLSAQRGFVAFTNHVAVIPLDRQEAMMAAQVRRALRLQGRSIRPRALDLLIAATALTHDLTLVTNNPDDYQDIPGLRLLAAGIT